MELVGFLFCISVQLASVEGTKRRNERKAMEWRRNWRKKWTRRKGRKVWFYAMKPYNVKKFLVDRHFVRMHIHQKLPFLETCKCCSTVRHRCCVHNGLSGLIKRDEHSAHALVRIWHLSPLPLPWKPSLNAMPVSRWFSVTPCNWFIVLCESIRSGASSVILTCVVAYNFFCEIYVTGWCKMVTETSKYSSLPRVEV